MRWCSQLRRWPKPRRSLETGLGLAMLFAGMMVRMPGGLHAQEAQDSADKVSRSPVLSAVAGRMRVAHSGVSDMDFGGLHLASLAPERLGIDLGLLFKPHFMTGDGLGLATDLGLAYPMPTNAGFLLVPRVGVSMLLSLPMFGWTGTHGAVGIIIPDRGGSAGIRFDAALIQYTGSSALRLTAGITSLPDWLKK